MKLLNEEKAMNLYMQGDIFGLEEMKNQVEMLILQGKEVHEDILQVLDFAIKVNYLVVETEMERYASDYEVEGLYQQVLNDVFKILEIDINYYWNR